VKHRKEGDPFRASRRCFRIDRIWSCEYAPNVIARVRLRCTGKQGDAEMPESEQARGAWRSLGCASITDDPYIFDTQVCLSSVSISQAGEMTRCSHRQPDGTTDAMSDPRQELNATEMMMSSSSATNRMSSRASLQLSAWRQLLCLTSPHLSIYYLLSSAKNPNEWPAYSSVLGGVAGPSPQDAACWKFLHADPQKRKQMRNSVPASSQRHSTGPTLPKKKKMTCHNQKKKGLEVMQCLAYEDAGSLGLEWHLKQLHQELLVLAALHQAVHLIRNQETAGQGQQEGPIRERQLSS